MKEQPDAPAPKRGEAAWKEERERIAERNSKTRKAGKEEREAHELQQGTSRREAEGRRMAQLLGKQKPLKQ